MIEPSVATTGNAAASLRCPMRPSGGRIDARERRDERARMSLADACLRKRRYGALRPWASRIVVRAGGCDCGHPGVMRGAGKSPAAGGNGKDQTRGAKDDRDAARRDRRPKKTLQARLSKQERAHDTRRKVLLGALVLHRLEASKDEEFSRRLGDWLRRELPGFLTRDVDKELFADLLKPPPVRSNPIEAAALLLEDDRDRDALTDSSRIATNPR